MDKMTHKIHEILNPTKISNNTVYIHRQYTDYLPLCDTGRIKITSNVASDRKPNKCVHYTIIIY